MLFIPAHIAGSVTEAARHIEAALPEWRDDVFLSFEHDALIIDAQWVDDDGIYHTVHGTVSESDTADVVRVDIGYLRDEHGRESDDERFDPRCLPRLAPHLAACWLAV